MSPNASYVRVSVIFGVGAPFVSFVAVTSPPFCGSRVI